MTFAQAVDAGLAAAMERDERVITFGEDVRMLRRTLLMRFGPDRVRDTPISEAAFLYAGIGAAMGGLRPVVEVMMVDFLAAAWCPLLNGAAKFEAMSGGIQGMPMVIRAAVGAGYGDGGQHGQTLWGSLSGIPGLKVVVPSNPADAAGLLLAAVLDDGPVVYLEHKLLGDIWLDVLGGSRRPNVSFEIPSDAVSGEVVEPIMSTAIGSASLRREGADVALVSVGVGVHRALEAATQLAEEGVQCAVLDLRSVAPLDHDAIVELAARTGRVVVVDEDYLRGGLAGEIAAVLAEARLPVRFARVGVLDTIPFARDLEAAALPNAGRVIEAVRQCLDLAPQSA